MVTASASKSSQIKSPMSFYFSTKNVGLYYNKIEKKVTTSKSAHGKFRPGQLTIRRKPITSVG